MRVTNMSNNHWSVFNTSAIEGTYFQTLPVWTEACAGEGH